VQKPTASKDKIIVALDVPNRQSAQKLLAELSGSVSFYKIGLQLFTREGPDIVKAVKETGAAIFLDLKFHDIPNTVEHAVRSACELDVNMLTIHLSGGAKMLRAAVAGAAGTQTQILGVTVLTSSSRDTLRETGVEATVEDQVLRLACLAIENGIHGLVASPLEVSLLRQLFGAKPTIVTPGVRPSWAEANDQQRTLTPQAAIQAGADYLVIGRPITAHPNPREAAEKIIEEIESR
jgi:orotidine-5'-phosphate decarboxylase